MRRSGLARGSMLALFDPLTCGRAGGFAGVLCCCDASAVDDCSMLAKLPLSVWAVTFADGAAALKVFASIVGTVMVCLPGSAAAARLARAWSRSHGRGLEGDGGAGCPSQHPVHGYRRMTFAARAVAEPFLAIGERRGGGAPRRTLHQ